MSKPITRGMQLDDALAELERLRDQEQELKQLRDGINRILRCYVASDVLPDDHVVAAMVGALRGL